MVEARQSLARSSLHLERDPTAREPRKAAMTELTETREDAVERLQAARELRTRYSEQYDAARGSLTELPAFTNLQAAEDQFAAREAWLAWIDRDY
jgi:hypothetical protein